MITARARSVSRINTSILQFNTDGVGPSIADAFYGMNRGFAPESGAFFVSSHSLLAVLLGSFICAGDQGSNDAVQVAMQLLGYTDRRRLGFQELSNLQTELKWRLFGCARFGSGRVVDPTRNDAISIA